MSGVESARGARTWVLEEVCVMLAATPDVVLELVAYRQVGDSDAAMRVFDQQSVNWLRRSLSLQRDLGIDALAAAMLAELLDENAALRRRVQLLERLAGLP